MAAPAVQAPRELQPSHAVETFGLRMPLEQEDPKILTNEMIDEFSTLDPESIGHESLLVTHQGEKAVMHQLQYGKENYWDQMSAFVPKWASMKSHKNVAELLAYSLSEDFPCVIRPYFSQGTILDFIEKKAEDLGGAATIKLIWGLVKGAAAGLMALHEADIVHGNLTLSNILVGDDGESKLVDLRGAVGGSWRWGGVDDDGEEHKESHVEDDKAWYLAPEVRGGGTGYSILPSCTKKSDIFAFGQCLHEIAESIDLLSDYSNLLHSMCTDDPNHRPSAQQVWTALAENDVLDATHKYVTDLSSILPSASEDFHESSGNRLLRLFNQVGESVPGSKKRRWMFSVSALLEDLCRYIRAQKVQEDIQNRRGHCTIVRTLAKIEWLRRFGELNNKLAELEVEVFANEQPGNDEAWNTSWDKHTRELLSILSNANRTVSGVEEFRCERTCEFVSTCHHEMETVGRDHTDEAKKAMSSAISELNQDNEYQYPPPNWFLPWYEVIFSRKYNAQLGNGSFGEAWTAMWNGQDVVVKILDKFWGDSQSFNSASASVNVESERQEDPQLNADDLKNKRKQTEYEAQIWSRLLSPRVVQFYGASHVTTQQFVCEHAQLGPLDMYLKNRVPEVSYIELWTLLLQACLGLQYLHDRGISHGDLKCDNILVDSYGMAKLADFGLSYESPCASDEDAKPDLPNPAVGAYEYKAPERVVNPKGDFASNLKIHPSEWTKSDVYSMGMCFIQALTGQSPFDGNIFYKELVAINRIALPFPAKLQYDSWKMQEDGWEWKLIKEMTAYLPRDRPKIHQVISRIQKKLHNLRS